MPEAANGQQAVVSLHLTKRTIVAVIGALTALYVAVNAGTGVIKSSAHDHGDEALIKAVVLQVKLDDEANWTEEELIERDAQLEAEREDEIRVKKIEGQIETTDTAVKGLQGDVGKLKTDVSNISSVQTKMAEDVGKLVRAIPDP